MFGDNFIHNCTRHFRTLFVHFANCETSILSIDAVHLLLQCICDDRGSPRSLSIMNICLPIHKHCAPFSDTGHVHNTFAIDCNKSSVNFTGSNVLRLQKPNHTSHLTVSGIWYRLVVTTHYNHNVKKFAAPGNYLHSTEHSKWLIWYNETTARVVCANVLYFLNSPPTCKAYEQAVIGMIAHSLYPFHSLLWTYDIWFTQTSSGMQLGQKQGLGIVTCKIKNLVLIDLICVFLEVFLTALYFRVTFRACTPLIQVPCVPECLWEGLGEHEALVWVGYKLLQRGNNLPCGVYYCKFLDFFPVWGEHSVNHGWLCTGEDVCQVCGHRPLLHHSTMGLAQEWTPPR